MIKTILLAFLTALLGFIIGVVEVFIYISKLNKKYERNNNKIVSYDDFKNGIDTFIPIGNILDVSFAYGFNERDIIEQENIDKMLMELSGDTENNDIAT